MTWYSYRVSYFQHPNACIFFTQLLPLYFPLQGIIVISYIIHLLNLHMNNPLVIRNFVTTDCICIRGRVYR